MIIEQYPYIDENGTEHNNLVRHSSDSDKYIVQLETGTEYEEAIDLYPCRYTYIESERVIQREEPALLEQAIDAKETQTNE